MTLHLSAVEAGYPDFSLGPLSLTVAPGVTSVLGPSGAGKSTLLALIAGFADPEAGTITLDGTRLEDRPPEERDIGMVFQNDALFPHLTVRENLAFGASDGADITATARRLEVADLLERDPTTLSGGERRRVALARTLLTDPDALLLDEPLSSLDAPIRRRLGLDLRELLANLDVPVVYVTHDQDEAAVVGDRLAVLLDGEVRQTGAVEAVLDAPATPRVARFLGMANEVHGRVVDDDDDRTRVDVGPATITADGTVAGERATVLCRPADVGLADRDDEGALPCRVSRVAPQQGGSLVCLAIEGGGELRSRVRRDEAAQLSPGERCFARIDPAQAHLLDPD